MDRRNFYAPDIDPYGLAQALNDWFTGQNYQTQMYPSESGAVTVQARKEDTLRAIAGMTSALTAVIVNDGENLTVEMGNAKWTDKAAVGAVGVLLFPPALITAGIGVFQQSQLQSNAWKFIDGYIRSNSSFASGMPPGGARPGQFSGGSVRQAGPQPSWQSAPQTPANRPAAPAGGRPATPPPINFANSQAAPGAPVGATVLCNSCRQPLRAGAKFCDNCGAPAPVKNNCRSCGKPLRPGARFCDECGTPV
jgi:hypothetical protein